LSLQISRGKVDFAEIDTVSATGMPVGIYVGINTIKSTVKQDFKVALVYIQSADIARKLRINCGKLSEHTGYPRSCIGGGKKVK
jgi:hypothetical protein